MRKMSLISTFNFYLLACIIMSSYASSSIISCPNYFAYSLNCEEQLNNFDKELIHSVIGQAPLSLQKRSVWASNASSSPYFRC